MDGWNTSFLLGWPIFRGYVSFRGCSCLRSAIRDGCCHGSQRCTTAQSLTLGCYDWEGREIKDDTLWCLPGRKHGEPLHPKKWDVFFCGDFLTFCHPKSDKKLEDTVSFGSSLQQMLLYLARAQIWLQDSRPFQLLGYPHEDFYESHRTINLTKTCPFGGCSWLFLSFVSDQLGPWCIWF